MPERPKRRKNNKNKRKNKNVRVDPNTSSGDSKNTENTNEIFDNENKEHEEEQASDDLTLMQDNSISSVPEETSTNTEIKSVDQEKLNTDSYNIKDEGDAFTIENKNGSEDTEDNSLVLNNYVVESPDQSMKKIKLSNGKKSKSVDDDESLKIVEITEECPSFSENNKDTGAVKDSVLILDVDSDVKWEKTLELKSNSPKVEEPLTSTLSITAIPLITAHCEQAKLLSPEEELSLRQYLQSLNLATNPATSLEIKTEIEQIIDSEIKHRLRKKGLAEDAFMQRLGPPRTLDVIDEEGSGESSFQSRRHSYLSDKKSDNDDLEDDVFEKPSTETSNKKDVKLDNITKKKLSFPQIPQKCVLVGAKLKEPDVSEARGNWTVQTVEKMTGAEVVYLTDSSSSTSSIYDIGEDVENEEDTDVSVRMITPTIEVTDTEHLLKKTFETTENADMIEKETIKSNNIFSDMEQKLHEVIVDSTDNIKTNLTVKDVVDTDRVTTNASAYAHELNYGNNYDLEMKVLKCELNDAINNLIKEVSDSESAIDNSKDTFTRQDSSSSVSSSQCTAIYNPSSSLNDVLNSTNDDLYQNDEEVKDYSKDVIPKSHVNDVIEHVTKNLTENSTYLENNIMQPQKLRDICVNKISLFPYGLKILEELANVSLRLQNINTVGSDLLENINNCTSTKKSLNQKTNHKSIPTTARGEEKSSERCSDPSPPPRPPPPPPLHPRNSSLKKSQESHQSSDVPLTKQPYVCLSPSQKMLMEKTNTLIDNKNILNVKDGNSKNFDKTMDKNVNCTENTFTKPLKSKTGSRLMALICDPAITNHITSNLHRVEDIQNNAMQKTIDKVSISSKKYSDRDQDSVSNLYKNTFKPVSFSSPKNNISSYYESDESSDFGAKSFKSMKKERKFFHFSTGNLNKEIEDDISTIQNMHKNYMNTKEQYSTVDSPRRPSLPKDLCDQQMEYIRQKEKEVEAEIRRLEAEKSKPVVKKGPRAPMIVEKETNNELTHRTPYAKGLLWNTVTHEKDKTSKISSLFSSSQEEILREKMYSEYLNEIAEREQRKQHKVIKIRNTPKSSDMKTISKSMSDLDIFDSKISNRIEEEFISKARERWNKLGIMDPESEDERYNKNNVYREPKVIEHKIKVIDGGEEKDVQKLPSHLQEFVTFTAKDKERESGTSAVWRPGVAAAPSASPGEPPSAAQSPIAPPPPPPPPIWTPAASPQTPRKTFRPVHFEDTPPARRKFAGAEQNGGTSGSDSEGRLRTSQSAPATGLSALGGTPSSRLPRAQNPTVTLLQKARENQISRASSNNIHERDPRLPRDRPSPPIGDPVHALRKGYLSEGEADRSDYAQIVGRKMADANRKVEGIGPTTKEGMPVALRSEVKDPSRWYKKMYDTIHKNKYDDDYVTIRYKNRQGQPPSRVSSSKSQYAYFDPRSGYLSEPEGGLSRLGSSTWSDAYDSDAAAGPRRRTASVQEDRRDDTFSPYLPNNKYSTLASARASHEVYKSQPGRIENYVPGKSSVVDKEAKQWWDEVMDIFDGWLDDNSPLPPYTTLLARAIQKSQNISSTTSLPQTSPKDKKDMTSTILSKSNMARALKESGYESDSTLVFRRREDTDGPLSPAERRAAYRDLQAGGEPPLRGFRSPAPPRQDESEIEYIPISSTLTKIRVHKKTPYLHEVICYPVSRIEPIDINDSNNTRCVYKKSDTMTDFPPAPPRRISSKNSTTLKLVTSSRHSSTSPSRLATGQSNVHFLKDKISHKLDRQNTQVIIKKVPKTRNIPKYREMSSSAPPTVNRKTSIVASTVPKKNALERGTSSFSSPRRTLQPTEYSSKNKCGESHKSVVLENGAGRKTPITNILDKVTTLDKLWSSQKRNERIDIVKHKEKDTNKTSMSVKSLTIGEARSFRNVTHKSRDMVRTSEKLQKLKNSNIQPVSNTPSNFKNSNNKPLKIGSLQTMTKISKSTSNIPSSTRKQNNVKTAVVTNLKKKKSLENVVIKPRSIPCHEICSKNPKGAIIKKDLRPKHNKQKTIISAELNNKTSEPFGNAVVEAVYDSNYSKDVKNKRISEKELKETRESVLSDTFFRHLFLGNESLPPSFVTEQSSLNTVLQKAKLFQSLPPVTHNTPNLLNSYLIHRKPVTLSRFKEWDKNPSLTRISGPRSVSWPGKMSSEVRKFESLSNCDEFGSVSSLSTVRSKSEPPTNKIYFSQTSRPVSPNVIFHKKEKIQEATESPIPNKILYMQPQTYSPITIKTPSQGIKSISQNRDSVTGKKISNTSKSVQKPIKIVKIKSDNSPTTIIFSQTSRPISPKVVKSTLFKSRSQSTSPVAFRSPSYRRIHNARIHNKQTNDIILKREVRTRSADDASIKQHMENSPLISGTESTLSVNDPDYDEYIRDTQNSKLRSERFRELNRYYTYLERVAELEKATSACDLRHRKKDEEIIDFDRWKKIRAIERAEEELNNLYNKLKLAQSENNILFYPKDLNDFRWNSVKERGLRVKEKSVEDLKEEFQQKPDYEMSESNQSKDSYKPLWRGTSVAETAFNINNKNKLDNKPPQEVKKPMIMIQHDSSLNELQKKIGIGNRLWSSLSMEQVNALKHQLNAIYSKELKSKGNNENEKYTVEVDTAKSLKKPSLHVRCNSLVTSPTTFEQQNSLTKSDSIAAIPCPITSVKDLKNNVNKMQMTLSEIEKKKISQSLSKEVLKRINRCDNSAPSISYSNNNEENVSDPQSSTRDFETKGVADEIKRHVVYPVDKTEATYQSSTSETETGSSDTSNKTVIYRGPKKEVLKKVEYFESVTNVSNQPKIIYHARENSDDNKTTQDNTTSNCEIKCESEKKQISQSQSCTNFKELFGESEKNKFLSLPSKHDLHSRSPSPYSEVCISDRRTPDTLMYSSDEAIWRSRTPSPDPERYWRTYIKLARAGEVRRLARRFDSPPSTGAILRRHRSDPELTRNVLYNDYSSAEKSSQWDKSRAMLPVARVPLRPTNRFMPHIDIISKLAALRRRASPRSRSAEEALECRPGEVERMRRRFETIALLGPIYSSAPDVRELQKIAPYLAGPWTAHRYPNPSDNNKSIQDPATLVKGLKSPKKKETKRPVLNGKVKLSSILKTDTLAKQDFDPSAHRPISRYEPPRAPPRPPPAAWPYKLAPIVTPSRHTVTFQENESAPEPPRRIPHGSFSDTESPSRRYVESDVNIHYRCPVRHDPLPLVPERELARQQAEHMKRLYREQRRNKYLQELQDMQNRRHQDNFMPSQKTVVPLNRYDEAEKMVARALYAFNGQTTRELSFKKGDLINIRRQIDSNWYEGEVHGRVGLFPYNYVEILKGDFTHSPKKPVTMEGQARAKFDFTAQTNLELPLKKGEVVVLTRRIDHNWWEGRNGTKTGIFPDSYVTVLQEPSQINPPTQMPSNLDKPAAAPAAHGLVNGAARRGLQQHSYTPQHNSPALANAPPATAPLPGYGAKAQSSMASLERAYGPTRASATDLNNAEPLYVDTNAEAVPYRAMYKYRPQNPDELELQEGDTVYVLEKCDDGWYVGSSQRTGRFGTFPGNYVERI